MLEDNLKEKQICEICNTEYDYLCLRYCDECYSNVCTNCWGSEFYNLDIRICGKCSKLKLKRTNRMRRIKKFFKKIMFWK